MQVISNIHYHFRGVNDLAAHVKTTLHARILDSVVFKRDIEVGRQDGHQFQIELDLTRGRKTETEHEEAVEWRGNHSTHAEYTRLKTL